MPDKKLLIVAWTLLLIGNGAILVGVSMGSMAVLSLAMAMCFGSVVLSAYQIACPVKYGITDNRSPPLYPEPHFKALKPLSNRAQP